ncbi:MAG: MmgE/PrpD family protein [Actinomycetota bacterium]
MRPLDLLGEWVAGLRWADVPPHVQHRARLTFRDTCGTIAGGARTVSGRVASAFATAAPSDVHRTFEVAVHASALDFDDGHYRGGAIHPASAVVPALLVAAGSDQPTDELLTAQVAAYEVGLRAAHLLWPKHPLDDYHCTGTAGAIAAAVAVAKLRGGSTDVVRRAIATAWAHAPMATFQLPMVKESIGWSAASGRAAADLAEAGFMQLTRPSASPIDATFTPTPFDRPAAMGDPFVASLGTVFEAGNNYFKPYAACRYTHTAARTVQAFGVGADDVESIEVHTHHGAKDLSDRRPASLDHAQYSFPFVLATMLLTGALGADEMSDESLDDPARLALAARVSVHHDPALDIEYPAHYGTRTVVRTYDGSVLEETRLVAPGDPGDPMTDDELLAKYQRLTAAG